MGAGAVREPVAPLTVHVQRWERRRSPSGRSWRSHNHKASLPSPENRRPSRFRRPLSRMLGRKTVPNRQPKRPSEFLALAKLPSLHGHGSPVVSRCHHAAVNFRADPATALDPAAQARIDPFQYLHAVVCPDADRSIALPPRRAQPPTSDAPVRAFGQNRRRPAVRRRCVAPCKTEPSLGAGCRITLSTGSSSKFNPTTPKPTATSEMPSTPSIGWTRRSQSSTRPCRSSPTSPTPTATSASPSPPTTSWTRRLRSTARPSKSNPLMPWPTTSSAPPLGPWASGTRRSQSGVESSKSSRTTPKHRRRAVVVPERPAPRGPPPDPPRGEGPAQRQEAAGQGPAAGQRSRLRRAIRPHAARPVFQPGPRIAAGTGLLNLGRLRQRGQLPAGAQGVRALLQPGAGPLGATHL